jgi:hypothetical protein
MRKLSLISVWGLALIFLITAQPRPAKAYVALFDQWGGYRIWYKDTVQWTVAGNGSDDLSLGQIETALQAAFDSWEDVNCSYIKFDFGGFQSFNPNKDIFIRWMENTWDFTVADAMGVTTNWKMNGPNAGTKKVEIFFNGLNFQWTVTGADDPFSNKVDLQATATHEIGHAIGLNHPRHRFSTMFFTAFPGQSEDGRTLEEDDKRGACFLYPQVSFKSGEVCDACAKPSNCKSGVCFNFGEEGAYCGQNCSSTQKCPDNYTCYNVEGADSAQCLPDNDHCAPTGGNIPLGVYCYDHATCASGKCLVLPDSAICSSSCNPSAGGNGGCPSTMKCLGEGVEGICYPKGDKALGDECKSPSECDSFLCIGIGDSIGICTKDCTTESQCPGTMKCMLGKCIPTGSGEHGDSCKKLTDCQSGICPPFLGYCTIQCEKTDDCPGESECLLSGVCNAGAQGKEGDTCGTTAKQCMSGLVCLYPSADVTLGTCRYQCDVRFDSGCADGLFCEWIWLDWQQKVVGICVLNNGGAGQGETCGGIISCLPDLICADTDGLGPKCRQDCNTSNFLGCSGGATCIPLNLPHNPKLGACHPKEAPPPVDDPQVVETTTDTGSPAEDTNPLPPEVDDDLGPAPDPGTQPPPATGSGGGGGCHLSDGNALGYGPIAVFGVLMVIGFAAYRRRSIM